MQVPRILLQDCAVFEVYCWYGTSHEWNASARCVCYDLLLPLAFSGAREVWEEAGPGEGPMVWGVVVEEVAVEVEVLLSEADSDVTEKPFWSHAAFSYHYSCWLLDDYSPDTNTVE